MAQIKSKQLDEVRIPFAKMSFTPDVPSTALGPNEYNRGLNIETDVRGIRSVAGDQEFLESVPGTPTFMSGGFRLQDEFWFIVATVEGYWWASNGSVPWYNITPGGGPIYGYAQNTNITEAWNGTVPFFNDGIGAPMFWPDEPNAILVQYSNLIKPAGVSAIVVGVSTVTITFDTAYTTAPYIAGQKIVITGINNYYNGTYTVVSSTTTDVTYTAVPGAAVPSPIPSSALVSPAYTWNYNPNWKTLTAGFLRIYSTPNVGSILVAGNLTATSVTDTAILGDTATGSAVINTPVAALTMQGALVTGSGIPPNATVVSVDPGISITINQPASATAYNVSLTLNLATNYPVTVQWSQNFGLNEAPLTWQPTVTNVANQLEVPLRGPCVDAFAFNGQFFLSSYWDTVVFSPINYSTTTAPILGVRLFNQGRGMLTSNAWANSDRTIYGIDARDVWVFDGQDFTGLGNQRVKNWFFDQLDPQYVDRLFMDCNTQRNQIEIYYTTKPEYANPNNPIVNGVPNKMISYRYDLEVWNPPRDVVSATFSCESPVFRDPLGYWTPDLGSRTIVYARGITDSKLVMKDQGYSFISTVDNLNGDIESYFRRDNIKMIPDYSGKIMVHRILPEVVNLNTSEIPIDPVTEPQLKGNLTVTIEGANSVGSVPSAKTPVTIPIDANGGTNADNPWAQINQNAFRVNTIELSNTSNATIWMCNATTWQYTQVEDDR